MRRGVGRKRAKDEEPGISEEEVDRVLEKLKDSKAMCEDGIPNKVWKYEGRAVRNWIGDLCKEIWKRGGNWPEDWKEGVIVPVIKGGEAERVENYRGVTLTQMAYKIYVAILAKRLKEEVEGKMLLPAS